MNEAETVAADVRRLADPRVALTVGTAAWVIATVTVLLSGDRWSGALPVCVAGIIVGLLGTGLFLIQRAASRRGSRGAQVGLD